MKVLQIDFKFTGPWRDELTASRKERAEEIAAVPGLIWKIWTENSDTGEGGGVYLFKDLESLRKYRRCAWRGLAKLLAQATYGPKSSMSMKRSQKSREIPSSREMQE